MTKNNQEETKPKGVMNGIVVKLLCIITTMINSALTERCTCNPGEYGLEVVDCATATETCKPCPDECETCQHWNFCETCKDRTYKSGVTCHFCSEKCLECLNQYQCTRCEDNYKLTVDESGCLENCGEKKYLESLSLGATCINCPDVNAKFCSDGLGEPIECDPGFEINKRADLSIFCRKGCPNKQGWRDDNTCHDCNDANCEKCNDNTFVCNTCDPGYWLNDTMINGLEPYCQKICDRPDQGFMYDLNDCKDCHPFSTFCENNTLHSLVCEDNYFVNETFHCQKKCDSDFYWDEPTNDCLICPDFCTTCKNRTGDCSTCQEGYWLNETWKRCQNICNVGEYFDFPNDCLSCTQHCDYCLNYTNECVFCESGFINNDKDLSNCITPADLITIKEMYLSKYQEKILMVFEQPIDDEIKIKELLEVELYYKDNSKIVEEEPSADAAAAGGGEPAASGGDGATSQVRLMEGEGAGTLEWEQMLTQQLYYNADIPKKFEPIKGEIYKVGELGFTESKMAFELPVIVKNISPEMILVVKDQKNRVVRGAKSGQYGNSKDFSPFVYPYKELIYFKFNKYIFESDIIPFILAIIVILIFITAIVLGIIKKNKNLFIVIQNIQYIILLKIVAIRMPSNMIIFNDVFGMLIPTQMININLQSSMAKNVCQPPRKFYEEGYGCFFLENSMIEFVLLIILASVKFLCLTGAYKPKMSSPPTSLSAKLDKFTTRSFQFKTLLIGILPVSVGVGASIANFNTSISSIISIVVAAFYSIILLYIFFKVSKFYKATKVKIPKKKKKKRFEVNNDDDESLVFDDVLVDENAEVLAKQSQKLQEYMIAFGYNEIDFDKTLKKSILPASVKITLFKTFPFFVLFGPISLGLTIPLATFSQIYQSVPFIFLQIYYLSIQYFFTLDKNPKESKYKYYIGSFRLTIFFLVLFMSIWTEENVDEFMRYWIFGIVWLILIFLLACYSLSLMLLSYKKRKRITAVAPMTDNTSNTDKERTGEEFDSSGPEGRPEDILNEGQEGMRSEDGTKKRKKKRSTKKKRMKKDNPADDSAIIGLKGD